MELTQYSCNNEHLFSYWCVHVPLAEVCVCVCWGGADGVGEQLHCRSIKGSVVITAEAVSVTSRLHYLVSFVPAFTARLIEWNCIFSLWLSKKCAWYWEPVRRDFFFHAFSPPPPPPSLPPASSSCPLLHPHCLTGRYFMNSWVPGEERLVKEARCV